MKDARGFTQLLEPGCAGEAYGWGYWWVHSDDPPEIFPLGHPSSCAEEVGTYYFVVELLMFPGPATASYKATVRFLD